MIINEGIGIVFREPDEKDMAIIEKWYGMPDYFGYATGFKNFSDIIQKLKISVESSTLSFMIYDRNNKDPKIGRAHV